MGGFPVASAAIPYPEIGGCVTLQVYCFAVHLMTFRSNDVDLAQSAASPRLSASGCSEGPEVAVFGGIRLCDVAGIARKKNR